ncbi:MAG: nitroreductase/quinone reductase family protein [Microbacterium gubbeenense]|uniref:nitroreductase/quinone reductase family protein n=2 Tax=Microbacterium gubbeenense TaxID=159896 RepID=UPI003F96BCE4
MAKKPFVPPRFVVTTAWRIHRLIARRGPGRGLWFPGEKNTWGALKITTTGRRSGQPREAILGYLVDGDDLHTLAMNGWGEGRPAWWINLGADPRARVMLKDGSTFEAVAHRAEGADYERLWAAWCDQEPGLADLAAARTTPTDVVVLRRAT